MKNSTNSIKYSREKFKIWLNVYIKYFLKDYFYNKQNVSHRTCTLSTLRKVLDIFLFVKYFR